MATMRKTSTSTLEEDVHGRRKSNACTPGKRSRILVTKSTARNTNEMK